MHDALHASDGVAAGMSAAGSLVDGGQPIRGTFTFTLNDADGNILYHEEQHNTVVTVGKNQILNSSLAGSGYTAANWMGLISTASFSAIAAGDTMASHAGWLEAGTANVPHYTTNRATATYGAAASGTIATGNCVFVFTGSGTVEGGFVVGGSGATNTIDNTGGVLIAAGTLSAVQPVIATNTLTLTHTLSM